jgi:hypothetical protein
LGKRNGFLSVGGLLRFLSPEGAFYHYMKKITQTCAVVAVWVGLAQASNACTVCMGGDGTVGEAANGAIFVMLGVLATVLGFISTVGYLIVRKGQLPLPPHAELARSMAGINID